MDDGSQVKKGSRGRPPYEPTLADRRRVAIGKASGMTHAALASALHIARETLEKYFEHELTAGADEKRLEIQEAMFKAAKKGNVAAARYLSQGVAASAAPVPEIPGAAPSPTADGLKAARDRAATTAQQGTEWQGVLQRKQLQ